MKDVNDHVILLLFTLSFVALLLALFNFWVPFGLAVFGILVLTLALGFGPRRRAGTIRRFLLFSLPCLCSDFRGHGVGRLHDRGPASCARLSGCDRLFGLRDMDSPGRYQFHLRNRILFFGTSRR